MNQLSSEEQQIVSILCTKYSPEAIVLVGSRVDGTATVDSDWDVFLFCGARRAGIELQENGLKIDVNFSAWPRENGYFDTGYGPVKDIKVLFDESEGMLATLLANTDAAYEKNPLELQDELSELRIRAFNRYIEKLEKYQDNEILSFYYKGKLLDLAITLWFQQKGKWSSPPPQALKEIDSEFVALLKALIESSKTEAVKTAKELGDVLFK